MKKRIFLIVSLFVSVTANNASVSCPAADDREVIYCEIKKNTNGPLLPIISTSEMMVKTSQCIYMDMPDDMTNAVLVITNNEGDVVKEDVVTVMKGQQLSYNIDDLINGTYEISIEDENTSIIGTFEVK